MNLPPLPRRRIFAWLASLSLAPRAATAACAVTPVKPAPPDPAPQPRLPVGETSHPAALAILRAIEHGRPLALYYHGGTTPGALRRFQPDSIYRLRPGGRLYTTGFCHLRRATRTLRLDRVSLA